MEQAYAFVGNHEFINFGHVLAPQGEIFTILPFANESKYKLDIEVIVSENHENIPQVRGDQGNNYKITYTTGWLENHSLVNLKFVIATTDNYEFFINSNITLVGNIERYAVDFRYAVSRKARS